MKKRLADGDDLKELIGYQLQMANLQVTGEAREALAGFDLSPAKVTALLLIRDNEGCEQSALGRAFSINRSSAMKLVNTLADRGLIERKPGRDLRSNALYLTEPGREELAQMVAVIRRADDEATGVLTAPERTELMRLLAKLRHDGAEAGPRPQASAD